jgi:hypothetical protein
VGSAAIGLKAEVSDTDEAAREHVEEEAPDEDRRLEGEELLGVAAPSIAVAKGHVAILECHQALVADGDAVGVSPEIA